MLSRRLATTASCRHTAKKLHQLTKTNILKLDQNIEVSKQTLTVPGGTMTSLGKRFHHVPPRTSLLSPSLAKISQQACVLFSNNNSAGFGMLQRQNAMTRPSRILLQPTRTMSTEKGNNNNNNNKQDGNAEEVTTTELAQLTPGQKVVAGTRLFMWSGIFAFACVCAYYIARELLPTKMSPNAIFDNAFNLLKDHPEITRRFGAPLKAYGRDHGGHREGRRNFVEHTNYTDKEDQSKRTRIRFNLEGQFGTAFVFAEVSSDMDSGEFVYVLVQDKRNGQVITVVDNRSALMAKRLAGGSQEGMDAFSKLLGGGGGKSS